MPIKVSGNQITADIEFAGQTIDQKRRSIKAMSKIVEVEDSNLEDSLGAKARAADMIAPDGTQLQSIADIHQPTDAEDPQQTS